MSEIHSLLAEQALYEAYDAVEEIEMVLEEIGYELPEDAALDEVVEMVEDFLATEDVDDETREELQEIIGRLAHAAGRVVRGAKKVRSAFKKKVGGIKRGIKKRIGGVKKKVGAFKRGVKASFRAGVKGKPRTAPAAAPAARRSAKPRVRKPIRRSASKERMRMKKYRKSSKGRRAAKIGRRALA